MFTQFQNRQSASGVTESEFSCSRDGLRIRGREYRPKGDGLPAAVVSHGFMANQNTVRHYALRLAELGYAAYCFDFNGGSAMGSRSPGLCCSIRLFVSRMTPVPAR